MAGAGCCLRPRHHQRKPEIDRPTLISARKFRATVFGIEAAPSDCRGAKLGRPLHYILGGEAVMTILVAAALICASTIPIAYLISHRRRDDESLQTYRIVRNALGFIGGPIPLSISLHAFLLLFLIVTMHETRARDLTVLRLEAGGGGGGGSE